MIYILLYPVLFGFLGILCRIAYLFIKHDQCYKLHRYYYELNNLFHDKTKVSSKLLLKRAKKLCQIIEYNNYHEIRRISEETQMAIYKLYDMIYYEHQCEPLLQKGWQPVFTPEGSYTLADVKRKNIDSLDDALEKLK